MSPVTRALAAVMLLTVIMFSAVPVFADEVKVSVDSSNFAMQKNEPAIQLTNEQVNEMEKLYNHMIDDKKVMISKYVQFGIMTEEQGKQAIKRMENHINNLKQNGFIPERKHCHKKHDRNSH